MGSISDFWKSVSQFIDQTQLFEEPIGQVPKLCFFVSYIVISKSFVILLHRIVCSTVAALNVSAAPIISDSMESC